MQSQFIRPDGRKVNETRQISFIPSFAPNSTGSVLASFGNTKVICSCFLEKNVPSWMKAQGVSGGWITAEYSMLPYSTIHRKKRDTNKQDGRSVEIQRLIGRSLRAVVDLEKLDGYTLWIDCDVLQADGGTRTASISGAYLAAKLAVRKLMETGELTQDIFKDSIAAISVGIYEGNCVLDLPYVEDKDASVDANIVMTGSGNFVEIQTSGEEASFSKDEFENLLALAKEGISQITKIQEEVLS